VVNRRTGVPRKLVRRVRAILHQAQHTGLAAQNRDGRPDFRRWLEGTVAYIAMVNPQQAAPLQQALAQVKAAERAA
jgi:RNA-directed DNA polymerase